MMIVQKTSIYVKNSNLKKSYVQDSDAIDCGLSKCVTYQLVVLGLPVTTNDPLQDEHIHVTPSLLTI